MAKLKSQELQRRLRAAEEARNKKANEDLQAYTKEITARRAKIAEQELAEEAKRLSTGNMTKNEQKNWDKYTKEEKLVIEKRLENDRDKRPLLSDKLGQDKKDRYEKGEMTEQEKKEYEASSTPSWMQRLNPHRRFDASGKLIDDMPGFAEGKPGTHINMPLYSDEQLDIMSDLMKKYQSGLPGLLEGLSKPSETGMSRQLQGMVGHMANPILQGIMNPGSSRGSQVLFPSQIDQQSNGMGLEELLGQLAGQAIPSGLQYASENLPAAFDYAASSRPGQFVQNLPGNFISMLSALGNRFRGNKQPQQ